MSAPARQLAPVCQCDDFETCAVCRIQPTPEPVSVCSRCGADYLRHGGWSAVCRECAASGEL